MGPFKKSDFGVLKDGLFIVLIVYFNYKINHFFWPFFSPKLDKEKTEIFDQDYGLTPLKKPDFLDPSLRMALFIV